MGLSETVEGAIDEAVDLVASVVEKLLKEPCGKEPCE